MVFWGGAARRAEWGALERAEGLRGERSEFVRLRLWRLSEVAIMEGDSHGAGTAALIVLQADLVSSGQLAL